MWGVNDSLIGMKLRNVDYSLVLVGRKAESYYRFRNYAIDAVFTGFTETPTYEHARDVAVGQALPHQGRDLNFLRR